jgi:hypothetical protein
MEKVQSPRRVSNPRPSVFKHSTLTIEKAEIVANSRFNEQVHSPHWVSNPRPSGL